MKAMRIYGTVLLLSLLWVYPSIAQNATRDELRQSLRTWAKKEVIPSMTLWKGQLDKAMSPEDLQTLNALRARAADLRQQTRKIGKALHEAWKSEDYAALKTNRDAMKNLHEQRKALVQELKPLATKYQTTLEEIGKAAQPKMQVWKEQSKAIVEQWKESHKDEGDHMPEGFLGRLHRLQDMPTSERRKFMIVRLMLWDGKEAPDEMNENMQPDPENAPEMGFTPGPEKAQTDGTGSSVIALDQNFPNPARDYATINYTVPEEQQITLMLYDQTGNPVTTLATGMVSAGEHSVQFETNSLPSGMYIYRLVTPTSSFHHTLQIIK